MIKVSNIIIILLFVLITLCLTCLNKSNNKIDFRKGPNECTSTCSINKENIWGAQFHPEKSHRFGVQFFKNFLEITKNA